MAGFDCCGVGTIPGTLLLPPPLLLLLALAPLTAAAVAPPAPLLTITPEDDAGVVLDFLAVGPRLGLIAATLAVRFWPTTTGDDCCLGPLTEEELEEES